MSEGIQARKMEVGEKIDFADKIITPALTEFGETSIVSFADESGKIFRKVFSNALAKHLEKNPKATSVLLKKKLQDGAYSYNVYE